MTPTTTLLASPPVRAVRTPTATSTAAATTRAVVAAARAALRSAGLVGLEARPKVLGINAVRFAAGALLGGGALLTAGAVRGLAAWVLLTTAVYVLNGMTDVEGDRVNGSRRPLASGRLPLHHARVAVHVCTAAAGVLALSVSWSFAVHVLVAHLLGVRYSLGARPAKSSSTGAFVVVVLGGLVTYHAGLVASGGHVTPSYVVFSVGLSAWMGAGSLLKDLGDVEGDRAARRSTLAVVRGPAAAAAVASAVVVAIAGTFLCFVLGPTETAPGLLAPALVTLAGAVMVVVTCVRASWRPRWGYHTFMYTQFAAHGTLVPLG